jgi:hypothetical protein
MTTKIDLISKHFNLPISFNSKKMELSQNIITDLELTNTNINADTKVVDEPLLPPPSMYDIILSPSTCFGKETMPMFSNYYTTDVDFLKDTQQLLKTYNNNDSSNGDSSNGDSSNGDETSEYDFEEINTVWKEIKGETSFCEKYLYIDWEMGKFLNSHASFLQIMSMYNVTSPIISFCLPILILIIPFFIINMKGLNLNLTEYTEILKTILSQHSLGKLFMNFTEVSLNEKIYLLFSAAIYVFSIYQNVLVCLKFYRNINTINIYLDKIKRYIDHSIKTFDYYLSVSENLTSYAEFNAVVKKNKGVLEEYRNILDDKNSRTISWNSILNIGNMLKLFYAMYDNEIYNSAMVFSFGLHGYLDNIKGLINNISNKHINYATFSNKTGFKKSFYPVLMNDESHVKNTCDFDKSMIITGPNASGKTTILKSSLINVILSQQFGCGCYSSATVSPYKFIHCYLNIPDTSGRDSLFQAEARRCKTIIEIINNNKEDSHFCAFDELYSGTNPDDAVSSSLAFMNYLLNYNNVTSILTTHYVKVCKKLSKNTNIKNYKMKIIEDADGTFKYTYVLESGISRIKGGLKVLSDMNYPTEILNKI